MQMPILLSICVPTYNRAACLDLALARISHQIKESGRQDIEVLVANNASTDNTQEIINKHKKANPYIETFTHNNNIGPDRNFISLVAAAKGRYCWIFGDDDILMDGALLEVTGILANNADLGLLHVSGSYHTDVRDVQMKRRVTSDCCEVFIGKEAFVERIGLFITFITGNIFNRSYLQETIDVRQFAGSNVVHVAFYVQSILKGRINIYSGVLIYSAMSDNTGGYRLFQTFGPNLDAVLSYFTPYGFKKKWIGSIQRKLCVSFFPQFIVRVRTKPSRFSSENIAKTLLPTFRQYGAFWFFVYPLVSLPQFAREPYYRCCRMIIRSAKFFGSCRVLGGDRGSRRPGDADVRVATSKSQVTLAK